MPFYRIIGHTQVLRRCVQRTADHSSLQMKVEEWGKHFWFRPEADTLPYAASFDGLFENTQRFSSTTHRRDWLIGAEVAAPLRWRRHCQHHRINCAFSQITNNCGCCGRGESPHFSIYRRQLCQNSPTNIIAVAIAISVKTRSIWKRDLGGDWGGGGDISIVSKDFRNLFVRQTNQIDLLTRCRQAEKYTSRGGRPTGSPLNHGTAHVLLDLNAPYQPLVLSVSFFNFFESKWDGDLILT
jgi:hypothetical protein